MKLKYKWIGKKFLTNLLDYKNKIILLLIFLSVYSLNAQPYSLKGIILEDRTEKPVIGATIKIKNTRYGDYSNIYGEFKIQNINKQKVILQISHVA